MLNKNNIVSGISIDLLGSLLATFIGFAVIPFYFHYIDTTQFGLWLALSGILALITLVDLGTDQYLTTVTVTDGKFYGEDYNLYFTSIILLKTAVSFIVILCASIIYWYLPHIIDIDIQRIEESQKAFFIGVFGLLVSMYASTFSTVLYARHHYSLVNFLASFFTIVSSVLTVGFLHLGYGILAFPIALLLANISQFFFLFFYMTKNYTHVKLQIKNFYFIERQELISYTTTFQILRWVHTLRTQYIVIAINNLVGALYVTQYNLTNKIPQMVPGYAIKLVHPFFPIIADLFHQNNVQGVQDIFTKISKILFRIAFFCGIVLFVLNKAFVHLWVGSDKFAGDFVATLLIVYMVIYVALGAFGIVIYASKEFENWTKWSIVEIVTAVGLSYILSFSYGFIGVVFGFVGASLISQVYLFLLVMKQLDIKSLSFLSHVLHYAFVPNILPCIFGMVIFLYFTIENWLYFVFFGFLFIFLGFFREIFSIIISKEKGIKNKIYKAFKL